MLHTAPSILCVTDRTLCPEHFLSQISRIAAAGPAGVNLREKDLCESAYRSLAAQVLSLCRQHQVPCILHTFPSAARALGATALHLPLPLLRAMPKEERAAFSSLGTSCHSIAEALEAQALGATYLLAGHIFDTSCKPGLPGRGLDFLAQVCAAVPLPVYAIGGITAETLPGVRRAGARGACFRSGFMTCPDPASYLHTLERSFSHAISP